MSSLFKVDGEQKSVLISPPLEGEGMGWGEIHLNIKKLQTPPLTPPLEGRGCCTPSEHTGVWTRSLGVEVTDPTPDPFAVRHKT